MSTSVLHGAGITARLPAGWEGRINQLTPVAPLPPPAARGRAAAPQPSPRPAGEVTKPFLHLANFPLPGKRGTFGGGVVDRMGPTNVFVALVEYASSCLGTALFSPEGLPAPLRPAVFAPHALQRSIPGQAGFQAFFTSSGRPFCLYVVLGAYRRARSLVPQVNAVLHGVSIGSA